VDRLANSERTIPREWINSEGNFVLDEFMDYVLPLIQGEIHIPYENGVPLHCALY
jgi:6-phosphofructokinase 1